MDFSRLTNPDAYKQALAGLLRRGGEVTNYLATAPEKAGQAILEGHERNKALQAQAFANPNRPFQVTDANAMSQLGDRMLAGPLSVAPVGMIAYHGTPHLIKDKFDISKVGTGEGAQAYGHGMYFAESPDVAKSYIVNSELAKTPEGKARSYAVTYPSEQEALEGAKKRLERLLNNEDIAEAEIQKQVIKSLEEKNLGGNLYKVDIPDEQIPKMLDWDKPLSQQPASVQNWLKDPYNAYKEKLTAKDVGGNEPTGNLIYNRLQELMSEGKKSDVFANQANLGALNASRELADYGITGIRYLDEGSRGTGKGTSNFVVFDPTDVKMLERNNEPLTRKEILQEQLDKIAK